MIECEHCGRAYFTRWGFNRHVGKHHPETERSDWEFGVTSYHITGHGGGDPIKARVKASRRAALAAPHDAEGTGE